MSLPFISDVCGIENQNESEAHEGEWGNKRKTKKNYTSLESITLQFQYTKLKTCKSEFTRINLRNGYLFLILCQGTYMYACIYSYTRLIYFYTMYHIQYSIFGMKASCLLTHSDFSSNVFLVEVFGVLGMQFGGLRGISKG